MSSAETVKVTIFNQTYSLRSLSGAEHVRGIASLVDERMKQIASQLTTHDVSKIAILVAMNVMDEMHNLKARYESEIERLHNSPAVDKAQMDDNAQALESERGSWFDEIFEGEMPARDRTERLSTQISAKLQSLRKNETPKSSMEETED